VFCSLFPNTIFNNGGVISVEKITTMMMDVENGREFGLFVNLEFTNNQEELTNITFTETTA